MPNPQEKKGNVLIKRKDGPEGGRCAPKREKKSVHDFHRKAQIAA